MKLDSNIGDRTLDPAADALGGRFECKVCWTVYDPKLGDPVWQIPPGTPFSALPHHWTCPNCSTEQSGFLALDD
ncbi:MAG: rubredoxin [Burkholderiales bacterium]|jgi:hydrogenase-1 operon protein HyaF|nr:rubredoxin [Burkholderiales bacterium]